MTLPLDGRTVRSPAEHRAAVASVGASTRPVLGWPTGERLQRTDPARFATLASWLWLSTRRDPPLELDAANDNMAAPIYRADRPTENELLEAAGRGPRVVITRRAKGLWGKPVRHPSAWRVDGDVVHLGELVFAGGALVRWGTSKRGAPLAPVEKLSPAARSGTGPSARWRKALHGVADGEAPKGAAVALVHYDADAELQRATELRIARAAVGPYFADVLDLAISSATAREIGEEFGYSGKHAERRAVEMIDAALSALDEHLTRVPANENDVAQAA